MVEELKLAIKVDDNAIEQSLLKQFANAEKMANKVVLTFNNIDLDDKVIEAKFKEMQKMAGKNPIDLSIDKSSIEMLSAISKQLGNIFNIAKGKSLIDSSATVADVNKITQSTNQQVKAVEKVTSSYKNQAYELASILKMLAKFDQYGEAPYAENLSKVVKSRASTYKEGNPIQFAALQNGFTEEMLKYLRGFSVNLDGAFNYSETLGLDNATISNVGELINYFRELLKIKVEFNNIKLNTSDIEELIKALGILKKEHFDDGTKTGRNIYGDGSLDKYSDISEICNYLKQQEEQAIATAQAEQKLVNAEKEAGKSSISESQNKIQEELKQTQEQAEQTAKAVQDVSEMPTKDVFQGDSKSATEASTSAIKEESKALEQVSTSAKEASESKENFSKANKEVKASADSSKTSISEEEKYFNSLGKSIKSYDNTLTSISRKPADGNRSQELREKIDIISSSIGKLKDLKSKTEENGYIFNKNDVETGRQLEKIIKENIELVRQMPAAQKGSDALSRGKELDTITKYLNKFTGISKQAKEELKGLIDQLQSGDPSVNVKKIHERFLELTAAERMAGRETKSFFDIFKNKVVHRFIGQLAMYYLSFYDFIRYARNAITAVRELDTALIDLKKTTTMSASELEQFYYDSNDVAKQMGVSTKEIIEQASAWSRLGSYIHTDLLYRNI